jgi:hypothetical protein
MEVNMATVVNTPATSDSGNAASFLTGLLILAVILALFFYMVLPTMRGIGSGTSGGGSGSAGTQLSVPDKVDVNVNQTP